MTKLFQAIHIMHDSLERHKEAADKLCDKMDAFCEIKHLPDPIKKVETHQNFARPA